MLFVVVTMFVILALCGALAVYVAYPHRGAEIPGAPWLGEAMTRAAGAVPVLDDGGADGPERQVLSDRP